MHMKIIIYDEYTSMYTVYIHNVTYMISLDRCFQSDGRWWYNLQIFVGWSTIPRTALICPSQLNSYYSGVFFRQNISLICLYNFRLLWTVKCVACVKFTNMSSNSLGFLSDTVEMCVASLCEPMISPFFGFFLIVTVFLLFWNTFIRFVITDHSQPYSNFSAWKGFSALPVLLKQYDACIDRSEVIQIIH